MVHTLAGQPAVVSAAPIWLGVSRLWLRLSGAADGEAKHSRRMAQTTIPRASGGRLPRF